MENQTRDTEIQLQDLWDIFKRCWWQMLIVLVAVSLLAFVFMTATHEDRYTARLTIYVMQKFDDKMTSTNDIAIAENLMGDLENLLMSRDNILKPVMTSENLEGFITVKELEGMISIKRVDEDARVLELAVTSSNAERSASIVNTLGEQACTYFNDMYKTELINIVDRATVPTGISNPISYIMILLCGFAGAFVLYMVYLVKRLMDDKINSAEDVSRYLNLSLLGVIPNRQESERKRTKYGYYAARHDASKQDA